MGSLALQYKVAYIKAQEHFVLITIIIMIKVFPWLLPFISFGGFFGILTDRSAASVLVWRRAEKRLNHWSVSIGQT